MATRGRMPIGILTGFLGSGKTTLLNRVLRSRAFARTAVLVNEFGEVGIDHMLVRAVADNVVLLESGCLCCAMRGDMVSALRDLDAGRASGRIAPFRRVLVETSGLADPAPILHTLMTDALAAARYRLDGVVTTVDAVNGDRQLDRHPESVKQAALADRLLVTKTDLATAGQTAALRARLARLNPGATAIEVLHGEVDPAQIFGAGLHDAGGGPVGLRRWLHGERPAPLMAAAAHAPDDGIRSFCLGFADPVEWEAFASALQALIDARGEALLRVKGLLAVAGEAGPVVVHGVQHLFHPPVALDEWPDAERASRVVFITRDLAREEVAAALAALQPRAYEPASG